MNIFKYLKYKHKNKKRIKLPRLHEYKYIESDTHKEAFNESVNIQKFIVDSINKYVPLDDCYNLSLAYGKNYNKVLDCVL